MVKIIVIVVVIVMVIIIIVIDDHVDNTVVNPSFGTWMKKRDVISVLPKEIDDRIESVKKHGVAEIVNNWDDNKH